MITIISLCSHITLKLDEEAVRRRTGQLIPPSESESIVCCGPGSHQSVWSSAAWNMQHCHRVTVQADRDWQQNMERGDYVDTAIGKEMK